MSAFGPKAVACLAALGLLAGCGGSTVASVVQTSELATTVATSTSSSLVPSTTSSEVATSVGHSQLTSSTPATGDSNSGWVAYNDSIAIYVSWVEASGQLTGTLEIASLDSAGAKVVPSSISFTGIRAGKQVSINLEDGRRWQGAVDDRNLTLRVPRADGTIADMILVHGGVDDYNIAVSMLQSSAGTTRSSVAQAQAQTAAAKQLAAAENELDAAVANLRATLDQLPGALAKYETAAHHDMVAALAVLSASAATQPLDCGDVGYQLSAVDYARSGVLYQNSSLAFVLDAISTAYDRLSRAQAALYLISEPDSRSADFAISDEQSKAVNPAVSVVAGVCLGRVRVEALLVGETAVVDAVVPIPGGHFQGEAYS